MKFSIIVPVYNVEPYLRDCLESILSQSFDDYEVICVNDASTDSSLKFLLRYAQKYKEIKIINYQIRKLHKIMLLEPQIAKNTCFIPH